MGATHDGGIHIAAIVGRATMDSEGAYQRGPVLAEIRYNAFGEPEILDPLDTNLDGSVDGDDDTLMGTGTTAGARWADYNRDGTTDYTDLSEYTTAHLAFTTHARDRLALNHVPLYAGYWWDAASQLYHVRNRVYDPVFGRWLQRDPIGYSGGWNLYQYVNNEPWLSVDPLGLVSDHFDGEAQKTNCDKLAENLATGKVCKATYDRLYKAWNCSNPYQIDSDVRWAYARGLKQGAWDGALTSTAAAADAFTFYMFDIGSIPSRRGWLYDPTDPNLVYSKWLGRVAGHSLQLATGLWIWQAAGGSTMVIRIGLTEMGEVHIVFGANGTLVHGMGVMGEVLVTEKFAEISLVTYLELSGIPVLFPAAVIQTGAYYGSCGAAALYAFLRGLGLPF